MNYLVCPHYSQKIVEGHILWLNYFNNCLGNVVDYQKYNNTHKDISSRKTEKRGRTVKGRKEK